MNTREHDLWHEHVRQIADPREAAICGVLYGEYMTAKDLIAKLAAAGNKDAVQALLRMNKGVLLKDVA